MISHVDATKSSANNVLVVQDLQTPHLIDLAPNTKQVTTVDHVLVSDFALLFIFW